MTPSIDQTLHHLANLLPNRTLLPILTLLPNFGGFHRTMQRVRLANRGRLLLRTPGPVRFGTCICSNVETILSWTCHVYGPFEFRTPLGTSILLQCSWYRYSSINCKCPLLPLESRHYSSRDWASPVSKSWYYWDIVKWSTQQPTTSKQQPTIIWSENEPQDWEDARTSQSTLLDANSSVAVAKISLPVNIAFTSLRLGIM